MPQLIADHPELSVQEISQNLKIAGHGYLVFVYPDHSNKLHDGFTMIIHVVKFKGDPQKTEERIRRVIEVLEGQMPDAAPGFDFCKYREFIKAVEN